VVFVRDGGYWICSNYAQLNLETTVGTIDPDSHRDPNIFNIDKVCILWPLFYLKTGQKVDPPLCREIHYSCGI
jgi:hypothetical protein